MTKALATVIRSLGGQQQVLLALGYVPVPNRKGWWFPSNGNRQIMFRQPDAIDRAFHRVEWSDRADVTATNERTL